MSSENTVKFGVYNLRDYFSKEPGDIDHCPTCKSEILKSSIPPSEALVDDLRHHSGIYLDYSYLYECLSCKWWAIRESWHDLNAAGWYDFLIIGESAASAGSEKTTSQEHFAWSKVLQNKDIYSNAVPFPPMLKYLFSDQRNEK